MMINFEEMNSNNMHVSDKSASKDEREAPLACTVYRCGMDAWTTDVRPKRMLTNDQVARWKHLGPRLAPAMKFRSLLQHTRLAEVAAETSTRH